jgi:hypothetical protein
MDAFASFYRFFYLVRLRRKGEDMLWWIPSKRGLFGVKYFYRVMGCHDVFISLVKVFGTKVPLRVAFFVWLVVQGKIPIMDNFQNQHVIVIDWCVMCKKKMVSLWTIFFIMRLLVPFGMCANVLGCYGLCLDE